MKVKLLLLLVAVLLCACFHPSLAIASDPDSSTTDNEHPPILEQNSSSASFETKDAKQVHEWITEEYKVIGGDPAESGAYVFTPCFRLLFLFFMSHVPYL